MKEKIKKNCVEIDFMYRTTTVVFLQYVLKVWGKIVPVQLPYKEISICVLQYGRKWTLNDMSVHTCYICKYSKNSNVATGFNANRVSFIFFGNPW